MSFTNEEPQGYKDHQESSFSDLTENSNSSPVGFLPSGQGPGTPPRPGGQALPLLQPPNKP